VEILRMQACNGKIRSVEAIPGMVHKGEWWGGWWTQLWYIVRTFVNATMYSQYNNNKKWKTKKK
jgi:hypothetical protein